MLRKLNASQLKIIACITMLIDHIGAGFIFYLPDNFKNVDIWYTMCRNIGRLALPIFCYMIVEGFVYTSSKKRYIVRMLTFAILSEIPFDLAFNNTLIYLGHQNVMFAFVLSLIMLSLVEKNDFRKNASPKIKLIIDIVIAIIFAGIGQLTKVDYFWFIPLLIFVLYKARGDKKTQLIAGAITYYWEVIGMFSFLILALYNGEKGKSSKYLFYIFYPLHLLIIWLARLCVGYCFNM